MPNIPLAQCQVAEVIIHGTMAAGGSSVAPAISVFHLKRTTTVNPWSNANIGAMVVATYLVPLLAASNTRYTPNRVSVRCVNDATDMPIDTAAPGNGAIATDGLPSDDAVCFILKTALRGKKYQGAKHFAGPNEVDTTDDILTGAGKTRWKAVGASLLAPQGDASGNTWNLCVLSRSLSQLKVNPTTVVSNNVSGINIDLNIGTMRRRRSKTVKEAC